MDNFSQTFDLRDALERLPVFSCVQFHLRAKPKIHYYSHFLQLISYRFNTNVHPKIYLLVRGYHFDENLVVGNYSTPKLAVPQPNDKPIGLNDESIT